MTIFHRTGVRRRLFSCHSLMFQVDCVIQSKPRSCLFYSLALATLAASVRPSCSPVPSPLARRRLSLSSSSFFTRRREHLGLLVVVAVAVALLLVASPRPRGSNSSSSNSSSSSSSSSSPSSSSRSSSSGWRFIVFAFARRAEGVADHEARSTFAAPTRRSACSPTAARDHQRDGARARHLRRSTCACPRPASISSSSSNSSLREGGRTSCAGAPLRPRAHARASAVEPTWASVDQHACSRPTTTSWPPSARPITSPSRRFSSRPPRAASFSLSPRHLREHRA